MNDWFSYRWPLHDEIATFRVDRSVSTRLAALGDQCVLIHVTCMPKASAAAFSFWERRRLSLFHARCAEAIGDGGVYAGSVEVGAQMRFFYYAADARSLVPIYSLCARERILSATCAKAAEPKAQTYFRFLLPDAAKLSGAENARLISERTKRGEDLAAYRKISLTFSFPTSSAVSAFLSSAREAGFALGCSDAPLMQECPNTAVLCAVSDLNWERLTNLTAHAIRLSEAVEGRYMRLRAESVERKQ